MRSFLLLLSTLSLAQAQVSIHGSVRGRVTDPTGNIVQNAAAALTNVETNTSQSVLTGSDGYYAFARVAPGSYTLRLEKEGFRKVVLEKIVVTVNEAATVDVQLAIGDQRETVTVEEAPPLVHSNSVEISGLVTERLVKELPLNGRNFQKLVLLAPGVGGQSGTTPNNASISGARPVNNTYTIDGIGSNDERLAVGFAGLSNGSGTDLGESVPNMISTESVREFRIISTNADATFGRASGGQINIVTKSGTNDLHGSAYHYLRNEKLDSRDFFNTGPFFNPDGSAKTPPFKQNLFGGTLGGRIRRDRHFFFTNYEGLIQRRLEQSAVTTAVPNADLIRLVPGDLGRYLRTYFIDRGIVPDQGNPAGTFAPLPAADRAAASAAGFPAALFDGNPANGEAGTVLISNAPPRNIDQHGFLLRTDHRLTDRLTVNARYSLTQSDVLAGTSALALNLQEGRRRYQQGTVQLLYAINASQVLEARGGVMRNRFEQFAVGGQIDSRLIALGIASDYGIAVNVGTFGSLFAANVNSAFIDNQTTPQVSLMHSWSRGKWTLRTGTDLRWVMLNVANISSGTPSYTFTPSPVGPNGIFGTSPGATQTVAVNAALSAYGVQAGPTTPMRGYRSAQHEYFAQADWRVRPDLTLNLGMRYSILGVYGESNGTIANLYAVNASGNVVPDVHPFQFGRTANRMELVAGGRPFYQPDYNNFQPRIGIAWDLGARGRTVVRAAYGTYYDRVTQLQFTNIVTNTPYALSSNTANVPFRLGATVPITAAANPAIALVNPELRNPLTQRWNVALERQIDSQTTVTVAYVGSRGSDLYGQTQIKGFGGVPQNLRPDARFSTQLMVDNLGDSRYRSLQVATRRRFAQGLDFTLAYTWARSRDTTSRDSFGTVPTLVNRGASAAAGFQGGGSQFAPRSLSADWGLSEFDVTHNLTFSHLYELPFGKNRLWGGWTLSGLAVIRSGEPVNITRGIDYNDDGDIAADRPQLLSGSLSDLYTRRSAGRTQYLIPQADALTRLNTPANVADPFAVIPRNALRAPRVAYYDLAVGRRFRVREAVALNFEANFFNLFDQVIFAAPTSNLSSALFGQLTRTLPGSNPRQIQFGVKLVF